MKLNNTVLGLAVASALGLAAPNAMAASHPIGDVVLDGASTTGTLLFAKEQNSSATAVYAANGSNMQVSFKAISSYPVDANNTLYLDISLLGGAKFETAVPKVYCNTTGAGGSYTAASRTLGAVGSTTISYSFPPNFKLAAGASAVCTFSVTALKVSNQEPVEVSAKITYKAGLTLKSTAAKGTLAKFVDAGILKISNESTTVTADVAQLSKKFTDVIPGTVTVAWLGDIRYYITAADVQYSKAALAMSAISLNTIVSGGSLVLSGPGLAAASKVSLKPYTATIASKCVAADILSVAPLTPDTTITFANITNEQLSARFDVCLTVDGSKAIDKGQITATFTANPKSSSYTPNTTSVSGENLAYIHKNGTTMRVLNIPKPGGVEKAFVRFYNVGNTPVRVVGTLYGPDGAVLASGVELYAALAGNSVEVLDSNQLATAMGATWTAGRAWLKIDAESDTFRVMGTLVDTTGKTSNLSGSGHN